MKRLDGPTGDFARHIFGPFTFEGITATGPDRTFDGELTLDVGGRAVHLIQVGPAHTAGDTLLMRFVTYASPSGGDRVGVVVDGAVHGFAPGVALLD